MAELREDGWNPVEWSLWALDAAARRLHEEAWHNVARAFAALGETVWWACLVDDILWEEGGGRYEQIRAREGVDGSLMALRHIRNRFAHDNEVIGYLQPGPGPEEYGSSGEWVWQPLPAATLGRAHGGEPEYRQLLEGRPVEATLDPVLRFLRKWGRDYAARWRGGTGPGVMVWTRRDETTGRTVILGQPTLHPGFIPGATRLSSQFPLVREVGNRDS
jgi:hypothetical protein